MLYSYSEFLNEYKKIDLSPERDVDDYHGFLFIHSDKPITLDEIQKQKTVRASFDNILDACGTESEYMYKIKTKHPLRNDNMERLKDFNPFDDTDIKREEKQYSGSFSSLFSSMPQIATVNTSDITYFQKIGGFCSYDKEKIKRSNRKLKPETEDFVSSFIMGSTLLRDELTDETIQDLKWTRPDEPITIYKGIEEVELKYHSEYEPPYKKGDIIKATWRGPASWTTNPMVARSFVDEYPSSQPFTIMMTAQPNQILMDTRKLNRLYYHTDQREITMLPGEYEFKIVWVGD